MVELSGMLIFMIVFFTAYGSWWRLNKLKQIALFGAARRCKESGVQLLDSTISLKRLWFRRDDSMKLRIWASYEFEFASLGRHRYPGLHHPAGRENPGHRNGTACHFRF